MARGRASSTLVGSLVSLCLVSSCGWLVALALGACGSEQIAAGTPAKIAPSGASSTTHAVSLPDGSSASSASGASAPPEAPHIIELPGVDTAEMLTSEKARFTELVEATSSPCGEAVTLDVCIVEKRGCDLCLPAAQMVAKLVSQGEYKGDIRHWLDQRFFDEQALQTIDIGNSPSTGPVKAPLQIIEFADFECPACGHAAPVLHALLSDGQPLANKIRLVFKHMPLKVHAHAEPAARASWAAQQQGKFWPMHALLFAHQDALSESDLTKYAQSLGLDMKRFRIDMESKKARDRIAEDYALGETIGLTGTPTLFINRRKFVPIGPDELSVQLERWLQLELTHAK